MQDDFTVFWRNNERAYDLFQDLLARAAKNAYDDDFLASLPPTARNRPKAKRRTSLPRSISCTTATWRVQ